MNIIVGNPASRQSSCHIMNEKLMKNCLQKVSGEKGTLHHHSVEITEIYSHQKKFRQVISLVRTLLSRNFAKKE